MSMSRQLTGKKDTQDEPLVNEATHALCVPSDYIYGSQTSDEGECTAAPAQL